MLLVCSNVEFALLNARILTCYASVFCAVVVSRESGMRYRKLRLPKFRAATSLSV